MGNISTSSDLATIPPANGHSVGQDNIDRDSAHLQALCEIITDTPLRFEEQVNRALLEGLAMLRLDLGIVSRIEENRYTILFFCPDGAPLEPQQVFDLNSTYCALTVENHDVVAIDHMANSPYSGHPCYSAFGLESYIGVPILVEGQPYGTLNFSSAVPRLTPFTEADRNFIRLMGRWIGTHLARNQRARELQSYRTRLENLVEERTLELSKANERLRGEIADNRLAQKTLIKQQAFLNTLIETIPIPVFYKDITGRYLGCNRAFEHFSQKTKADIIGKTVYDMAPKEIADKYFEKDRELFEKPGTQRYEWKARRTDGEEMAVVFEKATFSDEQGRLAGLVGSIFDITERKQMEKRLLQAQKLEALGTLSNGIAHDFNNILSGMMGYTELARMKLPDTSQARADLDKVYTAGIRAIELIKQILTFSRQSEQTLQRVPVGPVIKEVLKLMKATLPATIEIRSSIRADVTVMADPIQLHQVLMNLCTNSGQAMAARGGVLEVNLDSFAIDGDHDTPSRIASGAGAFMKLQIRDTGAGIPQDIIGRIFDPFFTTKDPGRGTGLGLSVVHGIVQGLGGTIQVASKPGEGTVFEIVLPLAVDGEEAAAERTDNFPHGHENILFIDDEEMLVDFGKGLLENLGYSVTGCTCSIRALAIFRKNPHMFDLVITDRTMPKMTGEMLAAELIRIRPDIPIILCSGLECTVNKEEAEARGIKAFILKPLLTEHMAKTIREVLDHSNPAREKAPPTHER